MATEPATETKLAADDIETPNSSNVRQYGYRHKDKVLVVQFQKSGEIWEYPNVPYEIFDQMRQADSVGSFVAKELRHGFKGQKVEEKKGAAV